MSGLFGKNEILKLVQGDEYVFGRIFKAYYSELVRFAIGYVRVEDQARELVQETFLKLWETKERLKDDSNIRAYLYTITRNRCINYLQHLRLTRQYEENSRNSADEEELHLMFLSYQPGDEMNLADLADQLNSLIESLPEKNRAVFKMHRVEGKTYTQIADEKGISVKAVEAHISRALKYLREKLSDHF